MMHIILFKTRGYQFAVGTVTFLFNSLRGWLNIDFSKPYIYGLWSARCCILFLYLLWIYTYTYRGPNARFKYLSMLLQVVPLLLFHIILTQVMQVPQAEGGVFSGDYFKSDFWVFFIPLVGYVAAVQRYPQLAIRKMRKAEPPANKDADIRLLLQIWKKEYYMPLLQQYLQLIIASQGMDTKCFYRLDLVCLERQDRLLYGYFANGEKWLIQQEQEEELLQSPWMVKINQQCHLNMLFVSSTLQGTRVAIIDENILQALAFQSKAENIFLLSKRLKANYYRFWEGPSLALLDEQEQLFKIRLEG